MRSSPPEPERLLGGLAQIEGAATRMSGLIDQIMDLAHLQMGRPLELRRHATDLVALVSQIAAQQQQDSEQHSIRVETSTERLIGAWDAARVERVVQNLLGNAIKYSPEGGEVVVTIARQEDVAGARAVLGVSDQGVGIPPTDLPHVFDRFHRAGNVVGRIAGTGIGLASARQIVEQHGGTISVESELGRGSTFTVQLPLVQ